MFGPLKQLLEEQKINILCIRIEEFFIFSTWSLNKTLTTTVVHAVLHAVG
jgi:hypothetical protein